jgi:DNA polymerase III gamma/tau subunit
LSFSSENDVLYGGRGRRHFHRIANQRFLEMIKTSRAEYHESRCKKTVAKRIVHDWKSQDPPGRFLQQESNTEKWFEIKPSKIMEKTCQALRDLKRERGPAGVKQGISERMIDPWEKSMPFAMTGQPMPMNNNGHMPPQPGQMHPHGQQGHAPFHPQQGQPWMGGNPMFPQGGMTGGMMASHPSMGQVPYQMPQPQQQPAQTSQPMEQPAPQSTPDDTPMAEKKEEEKKDESTEDNTKTAEASNEAINKTETKDNKEAAASDKVETNDKQATTEEANATEDAPVGEEVHAKELTEASEDKAGNDKGDKTAEDKRKNGELEAAALLANMFR